MRVLFIDHYDSFSFNLIDWLYQCVGVEHVERVPYDASDLEAIWQREPRPLVFSPGPKSPDMIEPSLALLKKAAYKVPILGICLGHQLIGYAFGGKIVPAAAPVHGTAINIKSFGNDAIFAQMPNEILEVATYNSLVIERSSLAQEFRITAVDEQGQIQAIQSCDASRPPLVGWQFHPESFLTRSRQELARAWLRSCAAE